MKKRLIWILAAAMLFACLFAVHVSAGTTVTEGTCGADGDNLIWTLDNSGVLTIRGTGAMAAYTGTSSVPWYSYSNIITEIVIDSGVTSVDTMFYSFVTYSSSVSDITVASDNANYCSENGVLFDKNKTTLFAYPASKPDTSYVIPDSVTTVRFFGSNPYLTSIHIPASVSSFGVFPVFGHTRNLTNITVDAANQNFCVDQGVLFSKDKTVLYRYPAGKTDTAYTIPSGVVSIQFGAFSSCGALTSVDIPESVRGIGNGAFQNCSNLQSVTIRNAAVSIGTASLQSVFHNTHADLVIHGYTGSTAEAYAETYGHTFEGSLGTYTPPHPAPLVPMATTSRGRWLTTAR